MPCRVVLEVGWPQPGACLAGDTTCGIVSGRHGNAVRHMDLYRPPKRIESTVNALAAGLDETGDLALSVPFNLAHPAINISERGDVVAAVSGDPLGGAH